MKNLSILEQLCFCTTRIETVNEKGETYSGSGFFYNFKLDDESGRGLTYLITNKHVAEGMTKIKFGISHADAQGNPLYQSPYYQEYNTQSGIIYHPDNDIDLCAIPIFLLLLFRKQMNNNIFYRTIGGEHIPSKQQLEKLEPVEDILLIGYPNGLWDEANNMPLVRKGITATAPYLDFNGKKEFVIDAACFPGSSGSPVFLYNKGTYQDQS